MGILSAAVVLLPGLALVPGGAGVLDPGADHPAPTPVRLLWPVGRGAPAQLADRRPSLPRQVRRGGPGDVLESDRGPARAGVLRLSAEQRHLAVFLHLRRVPLPVAFLAEPEARDWFLLCACSGWVCWPRATPGCFCPRPGSACCCAGKWGGVGWACSGWGGGAHPGAGGMVSPSADAAGRQRLPVARREYSGASAVAGGPEQGRGLHTLQPLEVCACHSTIPGATPPAASTTGNISTDPPSSVSSGSRKLLSSSCGSCCS